LIKLVDIRAKFVYETAFLASEATVDKSVDDFAADKDLTFPNAASVLVFSASIQKNFK